MTTPNLQQDAAKTRPRKAMKVFQDDVKVNHTSHWDWDYLPRNEVAQLAAARSYQAPVRTRGSSDPERSIRPLLFGAAGAAATATLSALLLLVG